MESNCGTCKWHEYFTGACFNGLSANCADFTSDNDLCERWEEKSDNEYSKLHADM